jgi:hypothetical protein
MKKDKKEDRASEGKGKLFLVGVNLITIQMILISILTRVLVFRSLIN